jgi:hypothetical protein
MKQRLRVIDVRVTLHEIGPNANPRPLTFERRSHDLRGRYHRERASMKAMLIRGYDGPKVFEAGEIETPRPGRGEVLVRVRGLSVTGEVVEVGPSVTRFAAGDRVFAFTGIDRGGGYGELAVVPEAHLGRVPASLSWAEAGTVPGGWPGTSRAPRGQDGAGAARLRALAPLLEHAAAHGHPPAAPARSARARPPSRGPGGAHPRRPGTSRAPRGQDGAGAARYRALAPRIEPVATHGHPRAPRACGT